CGQQRLAIGGQYQPENWPVRLIRARLHHSANRLAHEQHLNSGQHITSDANAQETRAASSNTPQGIVCKLQSIANLEISRMPDNPSAEEELLERALRTASHTRLLIVRPGSRHETASVFTGQFGADPAIVVADENTFAAAGREV